MPLAAVVRLRAWWVAGAVALVLALLAGTAEGQSVDEARQRRQAVQEKLNAAAVALEAVEVRIAELEAEEARLRGRVAELESEVAAASDRIADRVRSLYKHGSVDPVVTLLGAGDPNAAIEGATLVQRVVQDDRIVSEVATAGRTELLAVEQRLTVQQQQVAAAREEQARIVADLEDDFADAKRLEDRLVEEARRLAEAQARAAREAARQRELERQAAVRASGGYACPVGQPRSFTDSWGAPRSGGRRHKGTDILAPRHTPVYAVTGGTVDVRSPGRSAGRWIILHGVDGTSYYYMHLQTYTVADGARVSAGAQIATNGDSGNATGTPHVHFEQHPGGGSAVNPYPLVKRLCG